MENWFTLNLKMNKNENFTTWYQQLKLLVSVRCRNHFTSKRKCLKTDWHCSFRWLRCWNLVKFDGNTNTGKLISNVGGGGRDPWATIKIETTIDVHRGNNLDQFYIIGHSIHTPRAVSIMFGLIRLNKDIALGMRRSLSNCCHCFKCKSLDEATKQHTGGPPKSAGIVSINPPNCPIFPYFPPPPNRIWSYCCYYCYLIYAHCVCI